MAVPPTSWQGPEMRIALAAAAILTACSAPVAAQDTIAPGTVVVAPLSEASGAPAVRQIVAEAVATALADVGFTPLPGGSARYTATVTLTRTPRGTVAAGGSGFEGSGRLGDWGASALVALPSSKTQLRGLIVTELTIAIARQGEAAAWTGRAVTVQPDGMPADRPAALAPRLAKAALSAFPAQQAEAATVP